MLEIIATDTDGKQWVREVAIGEPLELRGDEVKIEIHVVTKMKARKRRLTSGRIV